MKTVCRGNCSRLMAAKLWAPSLQPDDILNVAQVRGVSAEGAAQHAVRLAGAHQHGGRQGAVAAHLGGGEVARQALALA